MRYRRRHSEGSWFENHSLPFLSIMLGVISVMVLTNMLFAVRQKQDQEQKNAVQLIGVPKNYVPVYIRCGATKISWQEESEWVGIDLDPLSSSGNRSIEDFMQYLSDIVKSSQTLGFEDKQHSIIIWVEPNGSELAMEVQGIIYYNKYPLRVGLLPVLEGETILASHGGAP